MIIILLIITINIYGIISILFRIQIVLHAANEKEVRLHKFVSSCYKLAQFHPKVKHSHVKYLNNARSLANIPDDFEIIDK